VLLVAGAARASPRGRLYLANDHAPAPTAAPAAAAAAAVLPLQVEMENGLRQLLT